MKFDLCFTQALKLRKPRTTVANPGTTPKTKLTGLRNTIYPISPMVKSNAPTKKEHIEEKKLEK
jgi:hypothetical protein